MKKMPIVLTFDVDGESLWLNRDPDNINRPVTLSLGQYGVLYGTPRILKLLKKYGVPATFFIPGKTAEDYPQLLDWIMEDNIHEIAQHSYSHKWPDNFPTKEAEQEDYAKASGIIEPKIGKKLLGYRSPAWEFSRNTVSILKEMGIQYSSNMMGTDNIEFLEIFGEKTDIVELPVSWILDDAPFWLFSMRLPGKTIQSLDSVEKHWIGEFDGLYNAFMEEECEGIDSDIAYVLTCHPQITGRHSRMQVLENTISHIASHPNVEFMTGIEAANRFRARKNK